MVSTFSTRSIKFGTIIFVDKIIQKFNRLKKLCLNLAQQIVIDGGSKKFITVRVINAKF